MSGQYGKLSSFAALASFLLVVAMLYWGQPVLMPLAMAVLLAFVLSPVVTVLRRWHVQRSIAVVLVVTLAFTLLGGVLLVIGRQFDNLARELPRYEDNIREKIRDLRQAFESDGLERTRRTLEEIKAEFKSSNGATASPVSTNPPTSAVSPSSASAVPPPPAAESPPPKELLSGLPAVLTRLVGPISSLLVTVGIVIVLVIFMLLRRDELRNRLILLGGLERWEVTTRILFEAGQRISHYLLTYTILNTIYGVAIAVGLYFIGLPYAFLWGFFAGIMRFIPYLGPWLGALLPVTLALAVFPGWIQPLLIVAYFILVELISNMLLEPIFYSQSAGVSEVALIVALTFWTWIWGPVGLLLGTPLTVCLVVLAKHVPALEPVHLLIGDGPVQEKGLIYYERLRTRKERRAQVIVREHVKESPRLRVFDELLLPALIFARHDQQGGKLSATAEECILRNVRKSIELTDASNAPDVRSGSSNGHGVITGIPCGGKAEELALLMLKKSLEDSGFDLEAVPSGLATSDCVEAVLRKRPSAVCIATLPPHDVKFVQEINAGLQDRGYGGRIIVARWGVDRRMGRLASTLGAAYEGSSLADTQAAILLELSKSPAEKGNQ